MTCDSGHVHFAVHPRALPMTIDVIQCPKCNGRWLNGASPNQEALIKYYLRYLPSGVSPQEARSRLTTIACNATRRVFMQHRLHDRNLTHSSNREMRT